LLSLNCQSLKNKSNEFRTLIETHKPEIITGTESWLNENIPSSQFFPTSYETFRRDRVTPGGGVFICVHKSLNATVSFVSETSEILWVHILSGTNISIKLAVIYKPDKNLAPIEELITHIQELNLEKKPSQFIIVTGDTNLPQVDWNNLDCNSKKEEIQKIIQLTNLGLTQLVHEPTRITEHTASTLDIILTNQPHKFHDIRTDDGIGDHRIILAEIEIHHKLLAKPSRKVFLYHRANVDLLKSEIKKCLPEFEKLCSKSDNLDEIYDKFVTVINNASSLSIPSKVLRQSNDPPWYNKNIRYLKKQTRLLHAKFKKTRQQADYEKYSEARKNLNREKRDRETTFLSENLDTMLKESQKRFWSYVKFKTKGQHSSVPTLKSESGELHSDPVEKANILNKHFQTVFTPHQNDSLPSFSSRTDETLSLTDITLAKAGIVNLIKKLNPHKSPGPDKISPKLLQLIPEEISDYLLLIFNKCFQQQDIPKIWKSANITPVFKKGNRSDPINYRPISLTSILCKMFEHIITSNLATFLEQNKLFNNDQFGFRKNRSCELQLLRVIQDLSLILDNKEEADLIFLDFSKAFDKVSHALLLHKLKSYGLQPDMISLIRSFLLDRKQTVVLDGWSSEPVDVTSGVPQGSVLGPILFLIYINDLPDKIKSKCRLFADDSLLYRKILGKEDVIQLQKDLDEVIMWCNTWHMTLNLDKCEHMNVTSKHAPSNADYKLDDQSLTKVKDYKYLGLHISDNLSWSKHINYITNKANKVLYVTKLALARSTQKVKETAYKSIVRPLVEYSSSVWDPYYANQIDSVEMIQRKAARFCLNRYQKMDSVTDMLQQLNWKPLASRRKASRLAAFSKVFNRDESLEDLSSLVIQAPYNALRNTNPLRIQSVTCRKNIGHYSFIPRSIREWNSLPPEILNLNSIQCPSDFRDLLLDKL
jgi:Reverse transcriptase (RNA-dependent DNA polymerase)/Endonuclease-reverse transcriptase